MGKPAKESHHEGVKPEWQLLTINRPLHQDVICLVRIIRSFKSCTGKSLLAPLNKNPVVIATVESQYVTEAAETEENTVSLIFKRTKHGIPATGQTLGYDQTVLLSLLVQYERREKIHLGSKRFESWRCCCIRS